MIDEATHFESLKAELIVKLGSCTKEEAWEIAEQFSKISEIVASQDADETVSRQHSQGVYYTDFRLARAIVREATKTLSTRAPAFLEPCSGGGAFVLPYIDEVFKRTDRRLSDLTEIVSNCFIADSDEFAINNFLEFFPHFSLKVFGHRLDFPLENVHVGDSLLSIDDDIPRIRDFRQLFQKRLGFDIVATNPPYKLLKRDRRRLSAGEDYIDEYCLKVSASKAFDFNPGIKNLYKLFIEAIIEKWAAPDAYVGLLIPQGFLTDIQTSSLRKRVLEKSDLQAIVKLQEGNEYFKPIGQAFVALIAKMGQETKVVTFSEMDTDSGSFIINSSIPRSELKKLSNIEALYELDNVELESLTHLGTLKKVQDYKFIVNQRGEFDMSLDSAFLADQKTVLQLIQGSKIARYKLSSSEKYVETRFLARPKGKWVSKARIACQQISNSNQELRLKWVRVPEGHVLANSTNFIAIDSDFGHEADTEMLLDFLLGILNSKILNARFKILSSNNHVSNHEISQFPIGEICENSVYEIALAVRNFASNPSDEADRQIEELVLKHFGCSSKLSGELK